MLFFDQNQNTPSQPGSTSEYTGGNDVIDQLTNLRDAVSKFVGPEVKTVFQNLTQQIVSIENTSKSLQRNMGGVAFNTQNFTQQLYEAYSTNLKIGATFKDSADVVGGLASEMGRMVGSSTENIANMVQFSKLAGISAESVGKMVAEMIRYGGTQQQALEQMNKMRKEAISLGLNANKFITEVNSNLKKLSGFGFKEGVSGLSNMVKQAQLLRTSINDIGAASLQSKVLDPEGAIQAAASFQMLGGAVGKLGDPFQLLYMAQSDLQGIQDELVKSTKAAYTFNQSTGQFEASTQDLYRLREQANIVNGDFEKMAEAGREAAKLEFIENAIDLSNVSEESKGLLAGLTTIQKGTGKIMVDIPGFDTQGKTLDQILADDEKKAELDKALAEYQSKMAMDDKQLAIDQLTISEKQAVDIRAIKETIMKNLSPEERIELENKIESSRKSVGTTTENLAKDAVTQSKSALNNLFGFYQDSTQYTEEMTQSEKEAANRGLQGGKEKIKVQDLLMGATPSAPQLLAKGKIYEGIVGDEVAIGTNLTEALSKKSGGNLTGAIDININLNGSISGDNGQISKMFNSPEIQKQIMDTVLYKLNDYKRQQGVLS